MAFAAAQPGVMRGLPIGPSTEIRDFLAYRWFWAYAQDLGEHAWSVFINNL